MSVCIIKPGILVRNSLGMILQASSTVTLVRAKGHNIMVDTGLPGEGKQILQGLSAQGLSANEIDIVINTHLHGDHMGNNGLFKEAHFIAHEREFPTRLANVRAIKGDYEVCENVSLIETPGHTLGSISVVVGVPGQSRTYVMAGDALPTKDNYIKWVPPAINFDAEVALLSMRRIVDTADVVVPGHGDMFEVEKKHSKKHR